MFKSFIFTLISTTLNNYYISSNVAVARNKNIEVQYK